MGLSKRQKQMVKDAIGDGKDWPKFTEDPRVNHAVDMLISGVPAWEELSNEERDLYHEEIEATKAERL